MTVSEQDSRPVPLGDAALTPRRSPVRADIQALRALAVGLVVLNHFWPSWFPGGYVGVDVFFVISGFLITSHLRRELDATGRIRLATFWSRRAKRLLPASLVVLVVTAAAALIWMPVTTWQKTVTQIAAAGAYILNWDLAAESTNYFAAGTTGTPVTHYWSLSVEEQFYLAWPLLLLAAVLLFGRTRRRALVALMSVVAAGSFAWAVLSVAADPSPAYFNTGVRAWEFALGGLLTFLPRPRIRWASAIAWLPWLVLLATAFRFNAGSGFPSWAALVPVLATAAVIWFSDPAGRFAPRFVTSRRPLQFLGNVSYSLYLWHWPLIFLAPYVLGHAVNSLARILLILVAILLAFLTKRYVEDPPRRSRARLLQRPRNVLILAAASVALMFAGSSVVIASVDVRAEHAARGLYEATIDPGECVGAQAALTGTSCADSHRLGNADDALVDVSRQVHTVPGGRACQSSQGDPEVSPCTFGSRSPMKHIALVGDSHAEVWTAALAAIAEPNRLTVTTYLESGCPPTLDDDLKYGPQKSDDLNAGCRAWREAAIEAVADDPSIDVVVTSSKQYSYVDAGTGQVDDGDGYVAAWQRWLDAGKDVVVINDVPDRVIDIPACISQHTADLDPCTASAAQFPAHGPLARAADQIADPRLTFVDYHDVFCDSTLCHSVIGGIPAYVDPSHLTAAFARTFAPRIAQLPALR